MTYLKTRSIEDVWEYEQKALDALESDSYLYSLSDYDEIRDLLDDQIMDEIDDCSYTSGDRRTS